MPRDAFLHTSALDDTDDHSASMDECIRPALRRAFSLPSQDERDPRFQRLLDALAERTNRAHQMAGENLPAQ